MDTLPDMSFADRITRYPIAVDQARADDVAAHFSALPQPVVDLIAATAGSSPYLASLLEKEADWLPQALDHEDVVARETAGFRIWMPMTSPSRFAGQNGGWRCSARWPIWAASGRWNR